MRGATCKNAQRLALAFQGGAQEVKTGRIAEFLHRSQKGQKGETARFREGGRTTSCLCSVKQNEPVCDAEAPTWFTGDVRCRVSGKSSLLAK